MASESRSWWRGACRFERGTGLIPGCWCHSTRVSVRLWYSFPCDVGWRYFSREIRAQHLFEKEVSERRFPDYQDGSWSSNLRLGLYEYLSLIRERRESWYSQILGNSYMMFQIYCIELLLDLCKCWVLDGTGGLKPNTCCRTMFFQQWSEYNRSSCNNCMFINFSSWYQRNLVLCTDDLPESGSYREFRFAPCDWCRWYRVSSLFW